MKRPTRAAIVLSIVAGASAVAYLLAVRHAARAALSSVPGESRPLRAVAVPRQGEVAWWGGSDVAAVASCGDGLVAAGASGVWLLQDEPRPLAGLPHLRMAALASWRRAPVAGAEAGGLYRWHGSGWEELLSDWGRLHVRVLRETEAGELVLGCREGLFVASAGGATLARWDVHPVRDVALVPGGVLAGGEEGLWRVEARRVQGIATPDPWIEHVGVSGDGLAVVTAAGLVMGRVGGELRAAAGGGDVVSGVWHDGTFAALTEADGVMRRLHPSGSGRQEWVGPGARRLLCAGGELFASSDEGLLVRRREGWRRMAPGLGGAMPMARTHVGAIAVRREGDEVLVGMFDGGIVRGGRRPVEGAAGPSFDWSSVGGDGAWGVNALLPVGEATYVASLRGASRLEEGRLDALPGPGAAFSLAATPSGVAVGYGQGVMLGRKMLSAFHGLPGNQALALASCRERDGTTLVVGTPSGLGSIRGERVGWRVTREDGTLPHPWITAVVPDGDGLIVGTYGGGLARRDGAGRMVPYPETAGWKVNAGALVEAEGRVYAGTDGRGLKRLGRDGRFETVAVALPSMRVTALAAAPGGIYVGTDEGLAFVGLPPPGVRRAGSTW